MNKKGDVAVTVLVFMAVVLVGATLFIFNTNTTKVRKDIVSPEILEGVYYRGNLINFYVQEAFESSDSIEEFKSNLGRYNQTEVGKDLEKLKKNFGEFSNPLILKIEIDETIEGFIIRYLYEREFVK